VHPHRVRRLLISGWTPVSAVRGKVDHLPHQGSLRWTREPRLERRGAPPRGKPPGPV